MIVESPYPEIVIPNACFSDYAFQEVEKHKNRIALIDEENPQNTLTFEEIKNLSTKYAIALQQHGIEKGDFISTCFSNCLEFPSIIIAAAACGAVITTCNPEYKENEIKKQFDNAAPKLIIVDHQSYWKIKKVAANFSVIKMIASIDENSLCESLYDWINSLSTNSYLKHVSIDPFNDVLLLLHSSGTTGLPKGVMLTHRNVVAYGEMFKLGFPHSADDCEYIPQPMFHMFGLMHTLSYVIQGCKTIIGKKFRAEKFMKLVEKYKITFFCAVPPMIISVYNSPLISNYNLSSLKTICCGSAPLPKSIAADVQKKLNVRLFQGFGMTECVMASASMYPVIPIDSVGVPFPNTQMKVVDVQSGMSLGPNQIGEVCGRNPLMMKGYYKNPAATSQCIDSDGWLHSGDLGYFDQFGFFFIVDRIKELIKYKGFQVAPAELEQVLLQHSQVKDAAVVGIPDPEAGELPKAFVVTSNLSLTSDDIHCFMKEKLSNYKQLRGGVEFCEQIPRNQSGKILRRQLKSRNHKSKL